MTGPKPEIDPSLLAWWTAYRTGQPLPPAANPQEEAMRATLLQRWQGQQASPSQPPVTMERSGGPSPYVLPQGVTDVPPSLAAFFRLYGMGPGPEHPVTSDLERQTRSQLIRRFHTYHRGLLKY